MDFGLKKRHVFVRNGAGYFDVVSKLYRFCVHRDFLFLFFCLNESYHPCASEIFFMHTIYAIFFSSHSLKFKVDSNRHNLKVIQKHLQL